MTSKRTSGYNNNSRQRSSSRKKKSIRIEIPRSHISKNTAYKRGRAFEYRVKKHFEKEGYYVKRSYASKGAEDLIAVKAHKESFMGITQTIGSKVLLIQCKNLSIEKRLSTKEIDNLRKLARQTGGTPLHVFNRKHKIVIVEVV